MKEKTALRLQRECGIKNSTSLTEGMEQCQSCSRPVCVLDEDEHESGPWAVVLRPTKCPGCGQATLLAYTTGGYESWEDVQGHPHICQGRR